MKNLFFSFVIALLLSLSILAQERQVEVFVDNSKGQSASLGGRVWLDVNDRMRVLGDVAFSDAFNLFLNPTDQVTAQGTAHIFLTPFDVNKSSQTRAFVFGGMQTTQFIGRANDAVSVPMGFGIQHFRNTGLEITPTLEFRTKDFTEANPILDKAYTANVYVKVPVGKSFRLSLNPYVSREQIFSTLYTRYGAKIGFIRVF